jgi:hypothetical protein
MVRAVRAPIQRTRAATEIPARQTIARAVRALRCALAESNMPVNLRCKRWQITSNVRVSELALKEFGVPFQCINSIV